MYIGFETVEGTSQGLPQSVSEIINGQDLLKMRIGLPEFALNCGEILGVFEGLNEKLLMLVGPILIDKFDRYFVLSLCV